MSGEHQLERSVLESKERDELQAIATAMGLRGNSRVRKSEIIDRILEAAGVVVGAGPVPAQEGLWGTSGTSDGGVEMAPYVVPTDDVATDDLATGDLAPGGVAKGDVAKGTVPSNGARSRGAGSGGVRSDRAGGDDGSSDAPATGDDAAVSASSAPVAGAPVVPARPARNPSRTRAAEGARSNGAGSAAGEQVALEGLGEVPPAHAGGSEPAPSSPGDRHPERKGHDLAQEGGNRRGRRRRGRGERADRDPQGAPSAVPDAQGHGEPVDVEGMLDLREEGFGFLRTSGYLPSSSDIYVSISQVRRFSLRRGDQVSGASRAAANNEKYPALVRVDTVNGMPAEQARDRPRFENLTPLFPDERLRLEVPGAVGGVPGTSGPGGVNGNITARIVDLLSPIGKGQRGLIVSPPKVGKTTVVKQVAHSIEANNPEVTVMVLLVDERPEEVTDMRRSVKGEVVASTFDRPSDEHTAVAELAIEKAKRMVEMGRDVVIILDGITRLARAYNLSAPASGRVLSGGVDSAALYPPKKFFGSARNIEEGGSLTILATALVETGSRMDEVIFEEFKGTGNMELRLDRKLAERRVYPAIDVNGSSTRHEELLFDRSQLQQVWKLRRVLNALGSEGSAAAGLELLMDKIKTTKSNDEFLAEIAKGPSLPA
ncbi:MAG: transcription termination factor Rho [Acidimicrobiales bacterium]